MPIKNSTCFISHAYITTSYNVIQPWNWKLIDVAYLEPPERRMKIKTYYWTRATFAVGTKQLDIKWSNSLLADTFQGDTIALKEEIAGFWPKYSYTYCFFSMVNLIFLNICLPIVLFSNMNINTKINKPTKNFNFTTIPK